MAWASRVLYAAVGCFVSVALLISISVSRQVMLGATPAMFLSGLILVALAIVLQLLELKQSNVTIEIESADVLGDSGKS